MDGRCRWHLGSWSKSLLNSVAIVPAYPSGVSLTPKHDHVEPKSGLRSGNCVHSKCIHVPSVPCPFQIFPLDGELGLGTGASTVGSIGVARVLDRLVGRKLEDLLEALANVHQDVLALLHGSALATSNIAIAPVRDTLTDGAGPDTDTEESLAHVDDNTHDFAIILFLKRLTNGAQHGVQPDVVDVAVALVLEAVGPLATMLVLGVLPLGAHTLLEEMVIGLEGKIADGSNVVLRVALHQYGDLRQLRQGITHVDSPKLLD